MVRRLVVAAAFLLVSILANANPLDACREHVKYGAPSTQPALLCRLAYVLSHNSAHKVPDWVGYHLTREHILAGNVPRSDDFRPDVDLEPGERSELKDYKGSGFDRGHMAPADVMKWSERAMSESFLLSNMAPQVGAGFNSGIWKSLEGKVQKWALARGELYVVTGPIHDSGTLGTIGANKVTVPGHFYMVIFDPVRVEAIAFILPNKKNPGSQLPTFIVSVDTVETKTGLDFLAELEDSVEQLIEAKIQPGLWAEQ
jgi:endonuclease G